MIQEYRKASAKKLFHHEQIRHSIELCEVRYRNEWHEWHPDTDLNQMGMIEDWLIEQGLELDLEYHAGHKQWHIQFGEDIMLSANGSDKSKPIAFMNCFMEWQRKEEG